MPNVGKPSRGCQPCKDRKVKVHTPLALIRCSSLRLIEISSTSVIKAFQNVVDVEETADYAQAIQPRLTSYFEIPSASTWTSIGDSSLSPLLSVRVALHLLVRQCLQTGTLSQSACFSTIM